MLKEKVCETIEKYSLFQPGDKVVVGVSGGPDSLCLVHLLRELEDDYRLKLHLAHLNHRLRGEEAEADAAFVEELAEKWGLPATIEGENVRAYAQAAHLSLKEAARRLRYSFLVRVAKEMGASCIAVGHNADDQVETIVMHWLRGAALAGLRGMLPKTLYEGTWLVRPLLEVTRAEIESYCESHDLKYRFDRSNLDLTYHRNRIRHELLPLLEEYNPRLRQTLRRSAEILAHDYAYIESQVRKAWAEIAQESDEAISFELEGWRILSPSLQCYILRKAIHRLRRSLRNINWVHIEEALSASLEKPAGTKVTLPRNLYLFKGYHSFTIASHLPQPDSPLLSSGETLPLNVPGTTNLPESDWQVEVRILPTEKLREDWERNPDPWRAALDHQRAGSELFLRRRLPGDRFQPLGMSQQKSLGEFMIDAKIPWHLRDALPLVVSSEQILWVAGWRIDERVKVTGATQKVLELQFKRG